MIDNQKLSQYLFAGYFSVLYFDKIHISNVYVEAGRVFETVSASLEITNTSLTNISYQNEKDTIIVFRQGNLLKISESRFFQTYAILRVDSARNVTITDVDV